MPSTELLNLAKYLQAQATPQNEILIRNIIGRAYYSSFHETQNITIQKYNWPESKNVHGGMHEKLFSRFDNSGITDASKKYEIEKIKVNMKMFKKKRVKADYHFGSEVTKLESARR